MSRQIRKRAAPEPTTGCGPLIPPLAETSRSLRQQVFERVRAAGLTARVQVARDLGVSPASVTTIVSELIEAGLVEEVATRRGGESGRGRPVVALGVRGAAHRVVGLKISDRDLSAVVMDFAGRLLAEHHEERRPVALAPAALLAVLETLLDRVTAKAGLARQELAAVGIGLPGYVDSTGGRVLWSSILAERDVPLGRLATERLGLPVQVDNDANLCAMAELWFGAGRRLSDFVVVTIEHGLGMGMVTNHRIFRGARGIGMELGHTKVQLDGALCRCGQRGCLEAYVADYALAREATTALNWTHRESQSMAILLESLHDHAKAGNQAARSIFRRAGRYLAVGLANIVNLVDPPLIILAGARLRFDYLYAEDTLAEMNALVLATGRPLPEIEIHAWGEMLWAHGAAALALSALGERLVAPVRDVAAQ
ncbi:ROK family protein [Cereibacter azotoformans]|uniref:Putative NBD/HSP70 family sugar kinase n=1 Tax=Cereibacter azotoformans TaxID=43057 RepID=A0A2T5K890_9RHOB|nr:ROK family transcriptional regulator [Cereibacter azotoformans]AXQ94981.1 ROK family transcriptional regulator [Cereibacter sphaeroides]MBO4170132.1 ROK family transcriptional regulator [Cereibacter azotoformans]PTR18589.1 putative NBD/HSP70 family sugar kinase [Cereibacter azotoformans]UIJ30571.1 ROK family protein [Cereibacter azotoformans]